MSYNALVDYDYTALFMSYVVSDYELNPSDTPLLMETDYLEFRIARKVTSHGDALAWKCYKLTLNLL